MNAYLLIVFNYHDINFNFFFFIKLIKPFLVGVK